jgi:hypothetical protein
MGNRNRKSEMRSPGAHEVGRDGEPGGEGGSRLHDFFASPTMLSESLTPSGLLAISLVLSAMLVALITTSVAS